ncbi:putative RNA-directed DNA polymerase from transposon BS [Trichonephila clavipes]|nr:putative RNA-directed DNA polymerase from transposon BS [Trichonephila clavipes]
MFKLYPLIGRNSELSRDNKVLLFTAVMRPILAYGCPVWGYAAKTNINILDTLQNSTIRMIIKIRLWPNPYRPISLLPVLSKLAEKVILARLNDHLERENILIPEQHGFRPLLSTTHQLLRVVEFIKEGNNKDECPAAVFLDIQNP